MSILDTFKLDGRVAVVTGASSGLGVAAAKALGEAGADLVLAARRADPLEGVAEALRSDGVSVETVVADVSVPADCDRVVEASLDRFGRLDHLVNNAGVAGAEPATRESEQHFRSIVDVNLMGSYWMAQRCARAMTPGSSMVMVSSALALTTAGLPQAAYTASKAALLGLTRDLAQQWSAGRRGIRVNAIAPGFFSTEMTSNYRPGYVADIIARRVPLGRQGEAEECAAAILFLLSRASAYVTGAVLPVDGGLLVT